MFDFLPSLRSVSLSFMIKVFPFVLSFFFITFSLYSFFLSFFLLYFFHSPPHSSLSLYLSFPGLTVVETAAVRQPVAVNSGGSERQYAQQHAAVEGSGGPHLGGSGNQTPEQYPAARTVTHSSRRTECEQNVFTSSPASPRFYSLGISFHLTAPLKVYDAQNDSFFPLF